MYGLAVVDAISDILISIGTRVSYSVGACKIIPAVPTTTAIVNSHKNKRSNTMATYFQSSFTCKNIINQLMIWCVCKCHQLCIIPAEYFSVSVLASGVGDCEMLTVAADTYVSMLRRSLKCFRPGSVSLTHTHTNPLTYRQIDVQYESNRIWTKHLPLCFPPPSLYDRQCS